MVLFLLFFSVCSIAPSYPKILFTPDYKNIVQYDWLNFVWMRAESFYEKGKFEPAIEAFQTASAIAEQRGEMKSFLKCRFYVGFCHWNQSRIEDSYQEYSWLLDRTNPNSFKNTKNEIKKIVEILDLYKLGIELRENREFKNSLGAFQKALKTAEEISRIELKQRILRQMSINYWEMNDLRNFYNFNDLSIELARKMKHKEEIGRCLNNIGIFHWKSFEYSKALRSYNQALEIFRDLKNRKEESNILHNLGIIYKDFGYYDKSMEHLNQALEIDKRDEREIYFPIDYMNIGTVYKLKAGTENNKELMHKAIDCFKKSYILADHQGNEVIKIKNLNNIGNSYIETNEYLKALPYLQKSLKKADEIHDYESMSMILNNIGYVYLRTEEYKNAEKFFEQAVRAAQDQQDYNTLWEAYCGLGILKEKKGGFSEAVEHYLNSIRVIETVKNRIVLDLHNAGYVQSKLKVFENLMDLLFSLYEKDSSGGYGKKMFHVAERSKARVLLDNLANSEFNHKKEISFDSEDFMAYMFKETQNYLKNHHAVIFEYFLGDKRSYLFRVTSEDLEIFPLPSKKSIAKSIQGYLKMLKSPSEGEFKGKAASRRIFKELLFPLCGLNPGSFQNIIIIPSGILYYLPFETLIDSSNKNNYLISQYQISYMPSSVSLIYLSLNRRNKAYKKDLLAFGNPAIREKIKSNKPESSDILIQLYENQNFEFFPLPYSEKEIKSISELFEDKRKDVFLRENASEESLKKSQLLDYKIIHFSCHGFLDEHYPSRSSLVLSLKNGEKEDGFLQVKEIYDLKMNPQLIVLSACHTGRGIIKRGEGVLGLPRVFFYAGAESILCSLWRVRDKQTAKFMQLFYKHLASGESKSHSLQLAKIEFIRSKKYSNPFYWAPFILNGEFVGQINF
ncbi:MAG: CHAT domain-containing protein [Acidobacteriota bacterium]